MTSDLGRLALPCLLVVLAIAFLDAVPQAFGLVPHTVIISVVVA